MRLEPCCQNQTRPEPLRDFPADCGRVRAVTHTCPCVAPRGEQRKERVNLQPYLGRSPSASSEVDILELLRNATLAPRSASQSKFTRSADGLLLELFWIQKCLEIREGPSGPLVPPLHS